MAGAINLLHDAGVINDMQLPELRTGGSLSAAGRELIENTLIDKVFQTSPDAVRQVIGNGTLRQSVVTGLNEIARNRMLAGSGYDLGDELSAAIDLASRAKAEDSEAYKEGRSVSPFSRQAGLFDDENSDSRVTDGVTLLLADLLNSGRPAELRKMLSVYNESAQNPASGQLDMFSGGLTTKEEIINAINDTFKNATRREQEAMVGAAVARRKDRAEAAGAGEGMDVAGGGNGSENREGTGGIQEFGERQSDLQSEEEVTAKLSSDTTDEYGKPLIIAKDGTTTFGVMAPESGLKEAPIRLTLGENHVGEDGKNHGYGLLHIEAGHGEQIRNVGFSSVEAFVEEVAKNYVNIREGAKIGDKQTYILEMTDDHNNTLFVQLSKDGTYWNINSAGIFNVKYSCRKPKVYSVPALGEYINTDTSEVNSGHSEGVTTPAGNSSKTSADKVINNTLGKLLSIRGSKIDARGIQVQGKLDPDGQVIAKVVKEAISLPKADIEERITNTLDRMGSDDQAVADEAALENAGLLIAHQYAEDITESKAEEKALRDSLKEAREDKDEGMMTDEAYDEYVAATNDAIR